MKENSESTHSLPKFDATTVPDGVFWFRAQYTNRSTGAPTWGGWELVYVHSVVYRKKTRRRVSSPFYSNDIDEMVKKEVVCEFYQIPLPPNYDDNEKPADRQEGDSMRSAGATAQSEG